MSSDKRPSLHRALGLWAALFYCFGDILGAGIYALVGEIAGAAGTLTPYAFLLALVAASLTALSYSELGTRHPRSGAEVAFVTRAFGTGSFALIIGLLVLCSAIVSSAAVAHAFSGYLGAFLPTVPKPLLLAGFLLAVALINYRGIEGSSRTNVAFTLIELAGLVIVIATGLWFLSRNAPAISSSTPPTREALLGITRGGALAFFAFIGFEDVINVAEEIKNPSKNLPRAILGALVLAGTVYLVVSWVAVKVAGSASLAESQAPLLRVVEIAAPTLPAWIFGAIAAFAVANTGLLNSITASRLLYGTADQGHLPAWMAVVGPRRRTPYRAVLLVLCLSLVLAFSGTLAFLAGTTAVLLLLVFGTIHIGLILTKLRESRLGELAEEERFSVPLLVPILGLVTSATLIVFVPVPSLLRALAIVIAASLLALMAKRAQPKRTPTADSEGLEPPKSA